VPDGSNIGVHGARGDLLGTLDGVQIPRGMVNANRRYVCNVKHERENLQEN
jgi:hypothetical protein